MPGGFLKKWLGDKGFGFITPDDGSGDLFAHIRQKAGAPDEAIGEGRRVTFETELDVQKGKPKAASWAFADSSMLPASAGAPEAAGAAPPSWPTAGGAASAPPPVDYQAVIQAANVAAAAISAGPGGQAAGDHLLANLAGIAGGVPGGPAPVAAFPPPPPPVPIKQLQEDVEVPAQVITDLFSQAGAGIEEIKRLAGGDIIIELVTSDAEASDESRTLRIRGPAVSASLGACLVLQHVAEVV